MQEPVQLAAQEQKKSQGREIIPGAIPNSTLMRPNVCYWAPIEYKVSRYPHAPGYKTEVSKSRQASEGVHRVMMEDEDHDERTCNSDGTVIAEPDKDTCLTQKMDPRLRPPKPPLPSHGYTAWHMIHYPKGSRYEGYVKTVADQNVTGRRILTEDRHGYGEMIYMDGRVYQGAWFDNQKHGRGSETLADGTRHVGDWKVDKKHGRGVVYYPHGAIDKGVWKRGRKERTILRGCQKASYDV